MIMSDWEIRKEYRWAKNKAEQVRILADENVCKHRAMWEHLISLGLDVPPIASVIDIRKRRRIPFKDDVFLMLYRRGLSDAAVAELMDVPYTTVYRARHRLGLGANGKGRRAAAPQQTLENI